MDIYGYEIVNTRNGLLYSFNSVGTNGSIKKIVEFSESKINNIYQFCFGDFDEKTGSFNQNAVTDNNDTQKVLNTLALICYNFTQTYPNSLTRFSSIDKIRIRLFSYWIVKNWDWIEKYFIVYGGRKDEQWERYRLNRRYTAFLIKKK